MSNPLHLETELTFSNRFTQELPADPLKTLEPRPVIGALFSDVNPEPSPAPSLLAYSPEVLELIGMNPEVVKTPEFTHWVSGNLCLEGMRPHASCYGGHQFGHWANQLGDGRAINLGEIKTDRGQHFTLQLKGAGRTPYSRTADGRAVLRSSVREFLCSEAMHHLGIPTTRALSLVTTGRSVVRDMFYDGHPKSEPGAIVLRVAESFTRFGHFELLAHRQQHALLEQLVDFTIRSDFPEIVGDEPKENTGRWFEVVCQRTAELIVQWQRVGFVHGVMNTDNMSILGLTIDYGPYGWLENYDPTWTPNTTDAAGRRYCFGNQPGIAGWNLTQLANALYPLIGSTAPLERGLDLFSQTFEASWREMMAQKLGLMTFKPDRDEAIIERLWSILEQLEIDMTLFFRILSQIAPVPHEIKSSEIAERFEPSFYRQDLITSGDIERLTDWMKDYLERTSEDTRTPEQKSAMMKAVNPRYVPRNYLTQMAIDAAEQGDPALIHELLEVFRHPYDDQEEHQRFAERRPDWARHRAGCSMLSCSS